MNNVLALFNEEITEKGLKELKSRFPSDLVVDMSEEEQFKDARKIRTERNKLVEAINRRRIDVTNELKSTGDNLIESINDIYSVVVDPFEIEDKRRKEEKERKKRELEILLEQERSKIKGIANFIIQCRGQDSNYIAEMIESVELIETESFHKDVIHEAIQTKKETIQELTQMLIDTKSREALEKERAELAEQQRVAELKAKAQERLNNLMMIPTTMFGKPSSEIEAKLNSIKNYEVQEAEFGEFFDQANAMKIQVITQLGSMLDQQLAMEKMQAQQSDGVDGSQPGEVTKHEAEQKTGLGLKMDSPKLNEMLQNELEQIQPEVSVHDKLNQLMYALTKHAARNSFIDFLEEWDLTEVDYQEVKEYLNINLGEVKTYL